VRKASLLAHRRDTFNDDSIDRNLRDHVFASEARIAQNLRGSFGHTGVWSPHAIRSSDQTDNVGRESHTNTTSHPPSSPLKLVVVLYWLRGPCCFFIWVGWFFISITCVCEEC
jgi:hypothetical protein